MRIIKSNNFFSSLQSEENVYENDAIYENE